MKLIGTRIRVEESEHFTRYFPEFEVEEKGWFRTKRCWSQVGEFSPFEFDRAYMRATVSGIEPHSKEWAETILHLQNLAYIREDNELQHQLTKKEYYLQ
ncbi:hypothetical protein D3C78_1388350 [compost metagenome]